MKKERIFCLVFCLTLFVFLGMGLAQEKYPSRPIDLVAPTVPGGSSDVMARMYSEELSQALKVPITVVNKPGGSGSIGTAYVINSKKDGYTLLNTPSSSVIIMPLISKEVTYDPLKDLVPLGYFASIPSFFAVLPDSPFKTFGELIEYARKNPGKLKDIHAGFGTEDAFNFNIVIAKAKVQIAQIPFQGGGEALPAALGGHGDMVTLSLSTLGTHIKAGRFRALGICSLTRHPDFPNVPTLAEQGYPEANFRNWNGPFAPAGTPKHVIDILVTAAEKALKHPDAVQRAQRLGFEVGYKSPEELRKLMVEQIPIAEKIARDANIYKK